MNIIRHNKQGVNYALWITLKYCLWILLITIDLPVDKWYNNKYRGGEKDWN